MGTLEYIRSFLWFDRYVCSTLGYVGSDLACIAFASIVVNITSTFGYFGSPLGYFVSTLEYIGSTLGYIGST